MTAMSRFAGVTSKLSKDYVDMSTNYLTNTHFGIMFEEKLPQPQKVMAVFRNLFTPLIQVTGIF